MNATPEPQDFSPLHEVYAQHFAIGTILSRRTIEEQRATDIARHHFNVITLENELKWCRIQPEEGRFDFREADRIIAFAIANNLDVVGHTLCWHRQVPDWVFEDEEGNPASREKLLERLRLHINTVMGRYRGIISAWDVVNEAADPSWEGDRVYRESPWYTIIGPEFVALAFKYARSADPDARLYYNDYETWWPSKIPRIRQIVEDVRRHGGEIDGIGMQSHWNIHSPLPHELEKAILTYSDLGVDVKHTEIDVSLYRWNETEDEYPEGVPEDVLQRQADHFSSLLEVALRHSDKISRLTFWGISDQFSWLNNHPVRGRPDHGLLFDRAFQPKPIFEAFHNKGEATSGPTDSSSD